MTDHITRVREQAERASREAYDFNGVRGHDSRNGTRRKAFIAGAVWGAERATPTREQIAEVIASSGAYGFKWEQVHPMTRDAYLAAADAVLALITGLAEGES